MRVTIVNPSTDADPLSLSLEPDTNLGTLKSMLEIELGIPILRQQLTINGLANSQLGDEKTLRQLNVQFDDVVLVTDKGNVGAGFGPNPPSVHDVLEATCNEQATRLMTSAQSNPSIMQDLERKQPTLAAAIKARDLKGVVREIKNAYRNFRPRNNASPPMVDPLSPEAQQMMFERIHQEQLAQNYEHAREYMPESFAEVVMLYVRLEVNNKPIVAFVDSGAQSTIMSESCAKRCGLDRLIDKRFSGIARGVGQAKVVGRIHMAQIKCGNAFLGASFVVLENQTMDFLFGLDLLRRHQCQINLRDNCLTIGEHTRVPFLSEADIKSAMDDNVMRTIIDTETSCTAQVPNFQTPHQPGLTASSKAISFTGSGRMNDPKSIPGLTAAAPAHPAPVQSTRPNAELTSSRRVHTQGAGELNAGGRIIEEQKIKTLRNLGVTEEEARDALRRCNGNAELAAAHLFNSAAL